MPGTNTVTMLNELIQISEDGMTGFAEAGRQSTASELKTSFESRSSDCGLAATELRGLVTSLGGSPNFSRTKAGTSQRSWTNVKSVIGDTNIALLEDAEAVDDAAQAAYAGALDSHLSKQVRDVIQRQFDSTVNHHDELRELRHRYEARNKAIVE